MRLRRHKLVRVHHSTLDGSFEGVWVGMLRGHYRLRPTSLLAHEQGKPITLGEVLIPVDKVAFLQVLAEDERH